MLFDSPFESKNATVINDPNNYIEKEKQKMSDESNNNDSKGMSENEGNSGKENSSIVATVNETLPSNRFELELEFIQCLASPAYLHHLATSGFLNDPAFLQFLQYLKYWKNPEYVRFISYPHCLYFLDLLCENEAFRREIANVGFRNFVHEQQFYSWQYRSQHLYGCGMAKKEVHDNTDGPDSLTNNASTTTKADNDSKGDDRQPSSLDADKS